MKGFFGFAAAYVLALVVLLFVDACHKESKPSPIPPVIIFKNCQVSEENKNGCECRKGVRIVDAKNTGAVVVDCSPR